MIPTVTALLTTTSRKGVVGSSADPESRPLDCTALVRHEHRTGEALQQFLGVTAETLHGQEPFVA